VLVARDGLGEREAFERLRRQARDQRRRVADVAAEVVRAAAGRPPTGGAAF
jgi:AmiR/NasT family two-component response regulator